MAKRQRRSTTRRTRETKRETNWLLIGGIVIGAVVILGLLALALQEPEKVTLADYCDNNPQNCISEGSEDAPVTLVEVSDYGCGHCRDFNLDSAEQIAAAFVDTGQVRWITVPYALSVQTTPAAESAYCAEEQDNFSAYHKQMFEIQSQPVALTPAGFLESASRAGLDLEQFNSCLEADKFGSRVQANLGAARTAGVSATPTFFINGVKVEGNNPAGIVAEIEKHLGS